jgi:non-specific serine/threonine protein kinase
VLPDFGRHAENRDAVERLCERLDHIPLAIELAAVRLRALRWDQILERLDDRFRLLARPTRTDGRHATLLATVAWSAQSCTARRGGVGAGVGLRRPVRPGRRDVRVRGRGPRRRRRGGRARRARGQVRDRRPARGPGGRYAWLDTLRDYGALLLPTAATTGAAARRHRDWYLSLARTLSPTWATFLTRRPRRAGAG